MAEIVTDGYEAEERPSRLKKGIISQVCRKGDKMDCTNFIGLTLYSVAD